MTCLASLLPIRRNNLRREHSSSPVLLGSFQSSTSSNATDLREGTLLDGVDKALVQILAVGLTHNRRILPGIQEAFLTYTSHKDRFGPRAFRDACGT